MLFLTHFLFPDRLQRSGWCVQHMLCQLVTAALDFFVRLLTIHEWKDNMAKEASKSPRAKAIQALRRRIAERPDTGQLWSAIIDVCDSENDRAIALVLGAIMEQAVETAILTHFIPMDSQQTACFFGPPQEAPITFDIKIRLAYALGIFGPNSRDDLTCIRHIRNVFAHTKTDITFVSDEINNICNELKYIDKVQWVGIAGHRPIYSIDKFFSAVRHYFLYLTIPPGGGLPLRYSTSQAHDFYA